MSILLQDTSGYIWTLTSDAFGRIVATKGSSGSAPNIYLNDITTGLFSWQVTGIEVSGDLELQTTPVAFNASYPAQLTLSSTFYLEVSNIGYLLTQFYIVLPSAIYAAPAAPVPSGQIIPLTSQPNQSFATTVQVDGAALTLNLTIRWNEMAGYWIMSVSDAQNNLLLDSIPMITGWYPAANLLSQQIYLAIGSAYILNAGTSTSDYPGRNDLGTNFQLLWGDTPSQVEPLAA